MPPVLGELVADSEPAKSHRQLVKRVEQAGAKLTKLQGMHAEAVEADKQAEADFATGGGKLPPPLAPDAQADVEQAQRELKLLEAELPASADRLFAEAHPHVEDALREIERRLDEDDRAVEAAIGEALRLLDERAEVAREGHWLGLAAWEPQISPFDSRGR